MALNFNVDPYYDDFDPTKNFHRVLFKPGYAVQARELTQSQTILQDQISKFGNGVFQDGSKVSGGNITVDTNVITAKLTSASAASISNFVGLYAVGQTSNFISLVNSVDISNYYIKTKPVNIANGKAFASGETINFYQTKVEALSSLNSAVTPSFTAVVKTTNTITRNSTGKYLSNTLTITTGNISVGDTIEITSIKYRGTVTSITDTTTLNLSVPLTADVTNGSTTITNEISVKALEVNIDDGVWYTNGLFVANYASSIIPDALNTYPSVVVGFEVDETTVDYTSDPSLLDPAIGASNYQAPGADRYHVTLNLVSKPYVSDQTVTNLTTNKFIELVRINAGVIEDINNTPIFTNISSAIAQAVSDTSGDFIVNPFSLNITNTATASNTFTSSISAGKAYINGYPVQHISQTPYLLEKARDITYLFNQDIATYYGDYTKIGQINGSIINFGVGPQVELHNAVFGIANSTTKIGTAKVRNFSYDSGSNSSVEYKSFLFDVQLTNDVFANVKSLIIPNSGSYSTPTFAANTVLPAMLIDNTYDSLVFSMPQNNTSNVSSVNYVTTRQFVVPSFTNGVTTITTNGTNETFIGGSGSINSSERLINYIVVATSSSGNYTAGQFIPMDQANVSINITNSPGTPQATVNIAGGFNGSATIYATISVVNDNSKSKVLHKNTAVLVSANTIDTQISLGLSDVYKFSGIYELGNTNPYLGAWSNTTSYSTNNAVLYDDGIVYISLGNTNQNNQPNTSISHWSQVTNNVANYLLDSGQRDAYYDHGTITNNTDSPRGNVVVVFDYFTHSGGTGYFDVNSYPVDYASIPNFISPQYGTTTQLGDALDFRPRRTDNATTFDSFQLPAPFNNVFLNYGYYLSRIDKVILYPNGQFQTLRGIPAYTNPAAPSDVPGTLTLFTIYYPAYTFNKNDVQVTPTNLRRYSMRDIGLLDKRISNLEYYTSLSVLENKVTGSDVTDATGLNLLFKNGYLVDGFNGSSVADVKNPDYAASIDPVNQLARPLFYSNVASYYVNTSQGTFVCSPNNKTNNQLSLKNNLVTFSYNEYNFISQQVATEIINVNPFNVINFVGQVGLSPSSDVWYSTCTKPNINIVNDDQSAWISAVNYTGHGSQWNDWQLNWTGLSTDTIISCACQTSITRDVTAITNAINSQGLYSAVGNGPVQVSSSTQIISNAVVPYARSIPITFKINGMAPYTKLHTFLDGGVVDSYVTPDIGSTDQINYINIIDGGTGYTDGNNQSIIVVDGANTLPVIATANVVGGQIVSVNITATGAGYTSIPTISVLGANTKPAVLTANGAGYMGSNLVTDQNGYVSGTIMIPNDNIVKIPTGTISVEFGDNLISPLVSKTYAKTTFYAQGTLQTSQTTVVSTRPPLVTPKPQVTSRGCSGGGSSVAPPVYNYVAPPVYNYCIGICNPPTPIITKPTVINVYPYTVVNGVPPCQVICYPQPPSPPPVPNPSVCPPYPPPPPPYVPVSYSGGASDLLNPGASQYTVGGAASYVYAEAFASNLLGGPVCTAIVDSGLDEITSTISSAQCGQPPTGTEALASIQYIANEVSSGVPYACAQASLACIINSYTGCLNALAASYVTSACNSAAYSSAHAAGCAAVCAAGGPSVLDGTDPLSQNFFIDATKYPNGVFLSSIDLFFATVDPTIPVSVRIRPVVNGFPDAVNDIPGSIVFKNPQDINIPADQSTSGLTSGIGPATTFTFDHPVYLPAGQFSILVSADSDQYTMYASKLGEIQYGTTNVVNSVTYTGSLFKSQNASTWVPAPSENLCFVLKICDFAGGSVTFDITSNSSPSLIRYDLMNLMTNDLTFNSLDSINYTVQTKDLKTGSTVGPITLLEGQNHQFLTRQKQNTSGDIVIKPTLTNIDRWTSPTIDLERLNTVLVMNYLAPYYSANTVQESLGGYNNGGAASRYITRRVTLNNNFASTGLTVFVDVNRQPGTKIEVYYKVLNQNDKNYFDAQPYVLMDPILTPGSGLPYTGATDFVSDTYQALNITYNDITTGTTYDNFNVFAIKICFYSSNPAIAPQIKNFRAIATA